MQSGEGWFERVRVDEEPQLIYSLPYTSVTGESQIVQVAFPIAQPLQYLGTLRLILAIGGSVVIVVAFAVSWVLARTALHPIDRIRRTHRRLALSTTSAAEWSMRGRPTRLDS